MRGQKRRHSPTMSGQKYWWPMRPFLTVHSEKAAGIIVAQLVKNPPAMQECFGLSRSVMYDPMDCSPPGCPWRFSRQEYWSGLLYPPPWESSHPRDQTQVSYIAGELHGKLLRFNSWAGKIPWRRDRPPTPVFLGSPGSSDSKESTCNAGDLGSIPGLGRSPGGGHGKPHQYSCLENPLG